MSQVVAAPPPSKPSKSKSSVAPTPASLPCGTPFVLSCKATYTCRQVHTQVCGQLQPLLSALPSARAYLAALAGGADAVATPRLGQPQAGHGADALSPRATTRAAAELSCPVFTVRVVNHKYGGCALCRKGSACKVRTGERERSLGGECDSGGRHDALWCGVVEDQRDRWERCACGQLCV